MRSNYSQSIKLKQSQVIHLALQRALRVLQMPVTELSEWALNEIEQNPTLNITETSAFYPHIPAENTPNPLTQIKQEITIFFDDPKEKALAYLLLDHLDADGFLTCSYNDLSQLLNQPTVKIKAICERISELEPCGIATLNLQHSLLTQLTCQSKQSELIYSIVEDHFRDFINGHLDRLAKLFSTTSMEIKNLLRKEIPDLNFHPARSTSQISTPSVPDVIISEQNGILTSKVTGSTIPKFEINPTYTALLETPDLRSDDRAYIRGQFAAGRWLQRMIDRRMDTLSQIAEFILEQQRQYFENNATLSPLSIKETAQFLGLTISTINRAIKDKTLLCPQGLFEMRYFFSTTQNSEISKHAIHEIIRELVGKEDKSKPLSDEKLASLLKAQNISCARRTIAKYRAALNILPASSRKIR